MFQAQADREISVPAEAAWTLLADWGNTEWLAGPEKTEVICSGDQVTRRLFMTGVAQPIEETLLSADQASRTLNYTIAVGEIFKLANYQGTISVQPMENGCRVCWACRFDQAGMSNEQAQAVADGNLNFLLGSLAAYLER